MVDKVAVELMEPEEMVVSDCVPLPDRQVQGRRPDWRRTHRGNKAAEGGHQDPWVYKQAPMVGPDATGDAYDLRDVSFFATSAGSAISLYAHLEVNQP